MPGNAGPVPCALEIAFLAEVCSDDDSPPDNLSRLLDSTTVEEILKTKHQGVRSFYETFKLLTKNKEALAQALKALLNVLLRVEQVRDLRGAAVIDAFKPFKEILESLQAAHDQASQDLYILYFHPVDGDLLYKQMRELKGMETLGVGIDMLPSKTTSETCCC